MIKKIKKIDEDKLYIITTDTLIGIGGKKNDFINEQIYEIKKRNKNKKNIVLVSSVEMLNNFEILTKEQIKKINHYWPGSNTLIINGNSYRMPKNKKLLSFIKLNGPLYLSSANISNQEYIHNLKHIKKTFPKIKIFSFTKGSGKPSNIINIDNNEKIR